MNDPLTVHMHRLSDHVVQLRIPTPTLPPSFETNTYIIHSGSQAIWVDAGTTDTNLLQQALTILIQLGNPRVVAIAATHYHRDHTHGLPYIQAHTKAPIYVHEADYKALRAELRAVTNQELEIATIPAAFQLEGLRVEVDHVPGHTRGHIHLRIPTDGVILVGDHLAGDGSVWIGPPDGNMDDYYEALDQIRSSNCSIAGPGHGQALNDASEAALQLKQRRLGREEQIVQLLAKGPKDVDGLVKDIYQDTLPAAAKWVADRTVIAHLERLVRLGRILEDKSNLSEAPRYKAAGEFS
ncbi:MBL fold metallo-hydrolase [Alicyclobacillus ferrooxydans]|nr:MBL fold metallo-hydrolase [Alicyclobacillus ferrooxydans]